MKFMAEQLEFEQFIPRERPKDGRYVIYTDGACLKNPGGPGGWCAIILCNGQRLETLRAAEDQTTNNRAELLAAIHGIGATPKGCQCVVMTDSQYVQKGAMFWSRGWIRKKWRNVKNTDLWQRLMAIKGERNCVFKWVRGHNGDKWNEECDKLAGECARSVYKFYEEETAV